MQGKTKGFFEDTGIVLVLVASIYGLYYLYDKTSNDQIIVSESVQVEKKINDDVSINTENFLEKNFYTLQNILIDILPLSQKEDISQLPKVIVKNNPIEDETLLVNQKIEKTGILEEKVSQVVKKVEENKIEETVQIVEKIEVDSSLAIKKEEETKEIEVVEKEKTVDIVMLRSFLRKIKFDIETNIIKDEYINTEKSKILNIRITILKNGNYEKLTFVDGNRKLFDNNKENILKVFPLDIDKSIQDEFPRYVRITIK